MGLKDLLKKTLTGTSSGGSRKNKVKMREIFNSLVMDEDVYTLIHCHMQDSHSATVVEANMHSNYIVGYKPGEAVAVPVSAQLIEWDEVEVFDKENGDKIASDWISYCSTSKEGVHYQLESTTYDPGIRAPTGYSIATAQSTAEIAEFHKFSKAGL